MTHTIDQQIAEAEAKLACLRQQHEPLENDQKIILGGILVNATKKDQKSENGLLLGLINLLLE